MKTMIKYSNCFGIVLALCVMMISGCSCSAPKPQPNPLAGFHAASKNPDQIITDDYQNYIQQLSPKEKGYVGPILYYEDGTGQHAVTFEIDKLNKDVWDHYLFYDKNNKRIKVEKYDRGSYWNP